MNLYTFLAIIFSVLIVSLTYENVKKMDKDVEIIKYQTNLQQCKVGGSILWQKECK